MLRSLIMRQLDREEQHIGTSVEYLRHIVRISLPVFLKFSLFIPLARHRHILAPAPYHVARLVATQTEDCGTCVQAEVNLARRAGVTVDVLDAIIHHRVEDLPADLADIYQFTQAVIDATGAEELLRPRLEARYGAAGVIELAFAIATACVYPTTKRALGYATSCDRVEIKI